MEDRFFVEIGVADHDTLIPLAEQGWRGMLVEPHPGLNQILDEMLTERDLHDRVILENRAASVSDNESVPFTASAIDQYKKSSWKRRVSGLSIPENTGDRFIETSEKLPEKEEVLVPTATLDTLLNDHNIESIDFLKLDIEGHDLDVLEAYSWRIRPTFLKVEHRHSDYRRMRKLLEEQNYLVWREPYDIYGVAQ